MSNQIAMYLLIALIPIAFAMGILFGMIYLAIRALKAAKLSHQSLKFCLAPDAFNEGHAKAIRDILGVKL